MRLIDADAIELEPDQYNAFAMNGVAFAGRFGGKTAAMVQNALKHMIDNAPTIDAVPVVHGRWFQHRLSVPKGRGQTYSVYGCSKCHKHEKKRTAYCPNCGAKMGKNNPE